MTPQSSFMVVAPLAEGRTAALRALLATMNRAPGVVDPENALVPFARLERLHVARFLIIEARTAEDIGAYGPLPPPWPASLAFLGDCDGPADTFLAEVARMASEGLQRIFSLCRDFTPGEDLAAWMRRHERASAANYINWVGRTVRRVREDEALHAALAGRLEAIAGRGAAPARLHAELVAFARAEQAAGRLVLTPEEPTSLDWRLREAVDLVAVPLVLLLLAPFLILASPVLAYALRSRERSDPEFVQRPEPAHLAQLTELEDHDVTNPFSAFGDLKPGRFRRLLVVSLLRLLDYSCRHVFNRGHLTRVQTIHFARWVFLDDKRRLLFASNYDGSLESYMDDFINKVGWGLNLVFSNGVGYPRTDWLIKRGSKDEQHFKSFLKRHQLPTDVWYKAYPGLTNVDIARNIEIRAGIERASLSDEEARRWLSLL
jgi:hypothetical protein